MWCLATCTDKGADVQAQHDASAGPTSVLELNQRSRAYEKLAFVKVHYGFPACDVRRLLLADSTRSVVNS